MYILNLTEFDWDYEGQHTFITLVHPTKTFEFKHLKEKWMKSGHPKTKEGFLAYLYEKGFRVPEKNVTHN